MTGHEMLVWGGAGRYRHVRQAGAAYDPALDSWRALPEAPLSWENEAAAVWTGTEWLIAAERDDEDASSAIIEVTAYDPATDAWRSLPQLELRESTWLGLAWTGTEPILSTGGPGVYRLRPGANAWERIAQHPADWLVGSTMTWTGDRMLGIVVQGGTRILASWDPVSDAWEVPAVAPHDLGSAELIWTGDGAVLLGADLAFDPVAESWLELKTPWWAERYLGVAHWTGDALVVWGGSDNSHADTRDDGVMLVPQW